MLKETSGNRVGEQASVQQPKISPKPKPAATVPGPLEMPGMGHSLGSSTTSSSSAASRSGRSMPDQRQSTPDPDEVRRRRLAFLEKQNQKK